MKTRTITVQFECDAPIHVLEEIAEQMIWCLDSLVDGTLYMDEYEDEAVFRPYDNAKVSIT